MTLQLNKEETVVKEDSRQDAWEVILRPHIIEHMFYVYILSGVTCCCVLCLTSWLSKKVTWQPAQGLTTCVSRSPTWIIHYHESDRQKLGRRDTWVENWKLDWAKKALITICSSVGCSHRVSQSCHYNKCLQSCSYLDYFSCKTTTELNGDKLHFASI